MITFAALYFEPRDDRSVPMRCFQQIRQFLGEYGIHMPVFFADGGPFGLEKQLDDIGENDLSTRGAELVETLQANLIKRLTLHCREDLVEGPSRPWASGYVMPGDGTFYLEADETTEPSPARLLRRACKIATESFDVQYGIAYRMPLADDPVSYADGATTSTITLSMLKKVLLEQGGTPSDLVIKDPWQDEMWGPRRYLSGMFRGAYQASVLSELHIRRANLISAKLGTLSRLDARLWCWDLSASEIPTAQEFLDNAGLLVK